MTNQALSNAIAGHGKHSHLVPSVVGLVVEMRDGQHAGTAIWRRGEGDGRRGDEWCFASYDAGTLATAERCVFVVGQDAEEIGEVAHGCDLDTPRGSFLIGVDLDDDLSWLSDGAEVLWDSAKEASDE